MEKSLAVRGILCVFVLFARAGVSAFRGQRAACLSSGKAVAHPDLSPAQAGEMGRRSRLRGGTSCDNAPAGVSVDGSGPVGTTRTRLWRVQWRNPSLCGGFSAFGSCLVTGVSPFVGSVLCGWLFSIMGGPRILSLSRYPCSPCRRVPVPPHHLRCLGQRRHPGRTQVTSTAQRHSRAPIGAEASLK